MPSPPSNLFLPRNGGSDSIRTTVSVAFPIANGTIVCIGTDGKIRPFSISHPNHPILGITEKSHPPMNTEADVVIQGLVRIDFIEHGKTYHLSDHGTLSLHGCRPVLWGIRKGEGLFSIPVLREDNYAPTGTMLQFSGLTVPQGWLECDGSLISQKQYPRLHSLLLENRKPIQARMMSKSSTLMVLAFDGHVPAGTDILLNTLGWQGQVTTMSSRDGILTVASNDEIPQYVDEVCNLLPADPANVFLPQKRDVDFKWIVKT
jgi:hypothetical protein